jgi:hypothetical protein
MNAHNIACTPSCTLIGVAEIYKIIILVKAVPLQAWGGPEDYRKLRFPDFMTTAQDVGKVLYLLSL